MSMRDWYDAREAKRKATQANIIEIAETWAECSDNAMATGRFDTTKVTLEKQAWLSADISAETGDHDASEEWHAIGMSLNPWEGQQ